MRRRGVELPTAALPATTEMRARTLVLLHFLSPARMLLSKAKTAKRRKTPYEPILMSHRVSVFDSSARQKVKLGKIGVMGYAFLRRVFSRFSCAPRRRRMRREHSRAIDCAPNWCRAGPVGHSTRWPRCGKRRPARSRFGFVRDATRELNGQFNSRARREIARRGESAGVRAATQMRPEAPRTRGLRSEIELGRAFVLSTRDAVLDVRHALRRPSGPSLFPLPSGVHYL